MKIKGDLSKMQVHFMNPINYHLNLGNTPVEMNKYLGNKISIIFEGVIHCVDCGKTIPKAYGQGFCYPCFLKSPMNSECIIRPELCEAHIGKGRDPEWEKKHHDQPHIVYLALTSSVKVGVTRLDQVPVRWIDQGAWKSIILAEVPYRQLAGQLEISMKQFMSDKTPWQKMLKNEMDRFTDLSDIKSEIQKYIPDNFRDYVVLDSSIYEFNYPVLAYPEKVKSINLLKESHIEGVFTGIRGQYIMIDQELVLNIRNHSGFQIILSFEH
ncbi:DUF2797 domain-containing protein [Bacteroidota bacterium]